MANPMFQHRHYVAIAKVFAELRHETVYAVLSDLTEMFERDNTNFDRERFFKAAAGEPSNGRDR